LLRKSTSPRRRALRKGLIWILRTVTGFFDVSPLP
jgi:hypothetical protein